MIKAECTGCRKVTDDFIITNYHHFKNDLIVLCHECFDKCIQEEKEENEKPKRRWFK